jgi:hypothetical protein
VIVVQGTTAGAAIRDEVEKVKVPVLQGRPHRATVRGNPADQVLPWSPFVLLLVVALVIVARSAWQGEWWIVAAGGVIVAIAIWGLRFSHRQAPAAGPFPTAVAATPSTGATEGRPVIGSFTIAGQIGSTATGTTGRLTLILPADLDVTAGPVIAALLTAGHRILNEHRLAHHPLPVVEVVAVDRAEERPATLSEPGFTVHITNDLTTRHSEVTVEAPQLPSTEGRVLLIAATLLAGAEHLLEDPASSLAPLLPQACRHQDRRRGRTSLRHAEPVADRPATKE